VPVLQLHETALSRRTPCGEVPKPLEAQHGTRAALRDADVARPQCAALAVARPLPVPPAHILVLVLFFAAEKRALLLLLAAVNLEVIPLRRSADPEGIPLREGKEFGEARTRASPVGAFVCA
jgi:hypothetical protein